MRSWFRFLGNRCCCCNQCSDGSVRGVSSFVFFKIIRYCPPASDVVPVEARLHDKNTIGFLHDGIIERDARQFAEPLAQGILEIFWRSKLGNKISQLRRVTIKFAQHRGHGPNEHASVPPEISSA